MTNILDFVMQLGTVAKAVLVVLLILSIISWAIIFEKWRQFRKIKNDTKKFLKAFEMKPDLNELYQYSRDLRYSPYAWMVRALHDEFQNSNRNLPEREEFSPVAVQSQTGMKRKLSSLTTVLNISHSHEVANMEKRLIILSTTVSVSPFLGLLGTVWGIMNAFLSIGLTGSADLASVGPGIAEALITTAAGLGVAIPALIAYNFFIDTVRQMDDKLDTFSAEMLHKLSGEVFE